MTTEPTPSAELSPLWCANDEPHGSHRERNQFGGWNECTGRPAIPPRIEDMAPVATHSSGEHRRVRLDQDDTLPVCDTCTNILGLNVRWDHAVLRHEREGIDPSTIRDVTPPPATSKETTDV